jgi:tetratricopeptide (TPR) repeat protein
MTTQPIVTGSAPDVTVVRNVTSEPAHIVPTLQALASQQDAPSFEVLLVLSLSADDAALAVRQCCDPYALPVRIVEEVGRENWRVRNRAIDECRTQRIAFLADDVVPEPSWLASVSRAAMTQGEPVSSAVMYDMALFDSGFRFEPWSDAGPSPAASPLAKAIRNASHALDDETAMLRHDWARIALTLGRLDEAWAIFDSLGDHPEYGAQASLYAGDFALRDRLWLNAERCFQKCLEHRPNWNVPVERLTAMLIQRANATANVHKKTALQRAALDRVRRVGRPSELQSYQRASLEAAIGSRDIARKLFTNLTAQSAFQAGAWFHLGEIALAGHDSTRAVAAFQHCLKLQPTHRKAISRLTSLLLDARMCGAMNVRQQGGTA